jgi:hypothetical protein
MLQNTNSMPSLSEDRGTQQAPFILKDAGFKSTS